MIRTSAEMYPVADRVASNPVKMAKISFFGILAVSAVLLAGCGNKDGSVAPGPQAQVNTEQSTLGTAPLQMPTIMADAGVRVEPAVDPEFKEIKGIASSIVFPTRRDPFALLAAESAFERAQTGERVFGQISGWTTMFTPPEEVPDEEEILDPPPFGIRLSGIIVSNGVVALLEFPGKTQAIDIRPGTKIEGTEWTVVSIDYEKAILRRTSNKSPKQIAVLLQGRIDGGGMTQPGGPGGAAPGGAGGPAGPATNPYGPGGRGGAGRPGIPGPGGKNDDV